MFQEALGHLREELTQFVDKFQRSEVHLTDRIAALEEIQKTIMIGAKKSLEVTRKVQRRQEQWEVKHEEHHGGRRVTIESPRSARSTPPGGWCAQVQTRGCQYAQLESKISEQERHLAKLDTEFTALVGVKSLTSSPRGRSQRLSLSDSHDGVLHGIETRLETGLRDVTSRLNNMQLQIDQQVLAPLWKISHELPAVISRQETLAAQTQGHAAKLGRQEVRLKTLSSRLEGSPAKTTSTPGAIVVSDAASTEERELAGRVDAHSIAISEIYDQLKAHSETLGTSRSSSVSSLCRNREPHSTTASSRNSSRGCVVSRHGPPPKTLSSKLAFSRDSFVRGR
jgi:hypothetical protein